MATLLNLIKKVLNNKKLIVILPVVVILFVLFPIVFIVLVFDRGIVPVYIEGRVLDSSDNPIQAATVKLQGKSTSTDSEGKFFIDGLVYGLYEIDISANGFAGIKEEIRLQRFANRFDVILNRQEFGELAIKLSPPADQPFYSSEFSFKLNDVDFSYNSDFVIETGRLLTGKYKLVMTSPYYKNETREIDVVPGRFELDLVLAPTADVIGEITNWLTGESIVPKVVEINNNGVFEAIDSKLFEQGQLKLVDLDIGEGFKIKIRKDGFEEFTKEITLVQGQNSLGEISLVETGKIVTLKDDGISRNIIISNLDGKRAVNLAESFLDCNIQSQSKARAVVLCGSSTISLVNLSDATIQTIRPVSLDGVSYDLNSSGVLFIDNSQTDKLHYFSRDKEPKLEDSTVLYSGDSPVLSAILRSDIVVFSTSDGVYKVATDGSDAVKISEGAFRITDISPGSNLALMLNDAGSGTNIWLIDLETKIKTKMTFLPSVHGSLQFLNDNEILYTSNKTAGIASLFIQSVSSNLPRLVRENVDEALVIKGTRVVQLKQGDKYFLLHIDFNKLAQIGG